MRELCRLVTLRPRLILPRDRTIFQTSLNFYLRTTSDYQGPPSSQTDRPLHPLRKYRMPPKQQKWEESSSEEESSDDGAPQQPIVARRKFGDEEDSDDVSKPSHYIDFLLTFCLGCG